LEGEIFFFNVTLMAPMVCWLLSQVLKVFWHRATKGKWNLGLLISAGGMPSAHSAFVSSLATAVAMREGVGSSAFAIAVVLALVVMYDAAGVRRAASTQARILNCILDELFQGHPISEKRLRELLGHTPFEVVVGALLGIAVTWLLMGRGGGW